MIYYISALLSYKERFYISLSCKSQRDDIETLERFLMVINVIGKFKRQIDLSQFNIQNH